MRGIAARLGVSATALYQHFESKSKILCEIRLYGAELLQSEVMDPAATIDSPSERLATAARRYVAFAHGHRWLYAVMLGSERLDWSQYSAEEIELLVRPLKTSHAWLREGQACGCWRPDLDVEMASFKIWMSMHGLCSVLLSAGLNDAITRMDELTFVERYIASIVASLQP